MSNQPLRWTPATGDYVRVKEASNSGRYDPRRTWGGPVTSIIDTLNVTVRDIVTGIERAVPICRLEPVGTAARREPRADD